MSAPPATINVPEVRFSAPPKARVPPVFTATVAVALLTVKDCAVSEEFIVTV